MIITYAVSDHFIGFLTPENSAVQIFKKKNKHLKSFLTA